MSNFPLLPGAVYDTYGADTSTTGGLSLSSTSSYMQITASTTKGYDGLIVQLFNKGSSNSSDACINIAIGAAASEQVICQNLKTSIRINQGRQILNTYLPIGVPAGSRISVLNQSSSATNLEIIIVGVAGYPLADHGCSYGESFGMAPTGSTSPYGTVVDPGGTANTLGSWVEMVASSAHNYSFISIFPGSNDGNINGTQQQWLLDVGVGAAGSEQVILQQLFLQNDTVNVLLYTPVLGPYACSIPAGSRISVRCQGSNNTAGTRKIDVGLIGFVR